MNTDLVHTVTVQVNPGKLQKSKEIYCGNEKNNFLKNCRNVN
jgi:hypothetical protein